MTKKGASQICVSILWLFLAVTLSSCSTTNGDIHVGIGDEPDWQVVDSGKGPPPHAPAHGYRAKHRYRYYPDSYVYFDVDRKLYFYLEDDEWRISASLPSNIRVGLGDHVTLDLDTDRPYEYSREHKHKYPPGQMKKKNKKK